MSTPCSSPLHENQKKALAEIMEGNVEGTLQAMAELCGKFAASAAEMEYPNIASYWSVRQNVIEEALHIIGTE